MSNVVPPFQRSENDALWSYVNEMASELRTLKTQLKEKPVSNNTDSKYLSDDYFSFVTKLRGKMKANVEKNYYPRIRIDGMELGIDFKGLLYDRKTNRTIPRALAFDVYHKLYDQHCIKPYFK